MPRVLSASLDETSSCLINRLRTLELRECRLSHAVSAFELRGSQSIEDLNPLAHKNKGLQRSRRAASSYPLSDVKTNVGHSASRIKSSSEKQCSESDQYSPCTPSSGPTNPENAYPSPPASETDEWESPSTQSDGSEEVIDSFPFPLNPVPLPPLTSSTASNSEAPHTPNRRPQSGTSPIPSPASTPDRFISNRRTPQGPSKTFRFSKPTARLSQSEKLLRHNSASTDPFGPLILPRLRDSRTGLPESSISRPTLSRPPRPIGTTNVTALPRDPLSVHNRQASTGAVWSIGGLPLSQHNGPVRSVSNGRGGFISGGSNAPMYTSRFFDKDTSDQDLDIMEARLAAALDIDQTLKVLDISRTSASPRSASLGSTGLKRKYPYVQPRTRWRYGDWVQEGSQTRKYSRIDVHRASFL